MSEKDFKEMFRHKRQKRIDKYGNGVNLVIATSLRYIDSDATLRNIICLNKSCNSTIRNVAYKQALLYSQPERLTLKRKLIWIDILRIVFIRL